MAYPILAPSNTWYKSSALRSTITEINIVDSYTPTGSETETWNADVDNSGSIKCYLNGTVLTIAGNGSGKIAMNADSSYLFSYIVSSASDANKVFINCTAINGTSLLDSSNVTSFKGTFAYCQSLTELDLSSWDVSNVTTFFYMFGTNVRLGQMSLVTLNLTGWNITNKCTNLAYMFAMCKSLTSLDISNWDTSNVTDMSYTFYSCGSLTSIDVSNWDVGNVTNMGRMFRDCRLIMSLDIGSWDVGNVTDMCQMFTYCTVLTSLDVSNWDVGNVTDMSYMFFGCTALTSLDVSNWDVGNVTDMNRMFSCGSDYGQIHMNVSTLDVSNWNTSSCTDMSFMFYGFQGCNLDLSKWDVSKVTTFDHMFAHSYINIGDVSNWATPAATNMNAMFYSVANETLDVSKLVTKNVTCFDQMFENCQKLTKIIGLEKFDTSSSYGFSEMFQNCYMLKELDLSSFDTRKAKDGFACSSNGSTTTSMADIFTDMRRLEKITLGANFSFNGDGTSSNIAVLPTPSTEYFEDADGNWYTYDGVAYSPADAVKTVPMTYYVVNPILDRDYLVKGRTVLQLANAIKAKTGITGSLTPAQMIEAIKNITVAASDDGNGNVTLHLSGAMNDNITIS